MLGKLLFMFDRLDFYLVKVQKALVIAVGLFMSIGMTWTIFSRLIFKNPLLGMEELIVVGGLWFYMIGVALAGSERSHLRVEIVPMLIKNKKVLAVIEVCLSVVTLIVAGIILYWCFDLLAWAIEKKSILAATKMPAYVPQSSFSLAMFLLVLYFARDLLRDIKTLCEVFRDGAATPEAAQGEGQ